MRIVQGAAAARESILRRANGGELALPASVREDIRRVFGAELNVAGVVERILSDVQSRGDAAVKHYNRQLDGVRDDTPAQVTREEIEGAYKSVDPAVVDALKTAAARIRAFHETQLEYSIRGFQNGGIGQTVTAIERVGIYVPGTAAVYPSTVLMTAIPARVAGVRELVMATPAAVDGTVSPLKLVAADICEVDSVYRAGGAQGIAALTYGTDSIPAVDKICGPGNIFVTAAKKRVYGKVGIDGIFGPSETLVVADETADPALVTADLLAGAEHDLLATAVLITTSVALAETVAEISDENLGQLARHEIASASLNTRGGIVIVDSLGEAIALANEFAPEHLCLHVSEAQAVLGQVRNAGGVFAGEASVESVGDYAAGPSHVMPTGGSARFASPLGVHDFLKVTSVISLRPETLEEAGPPSAVIARAEGLTGHAASIEARLKGKLS